MNFGGPHWTLASVARTEYFQRLSHYLRFGAAGLTRNVLKEGGHLGVNPDAQLGHDQVESQSAIQAD
jgi:hypothetical protein